MSFRSETVEILGVTSLNFQNLGYLEERLDRLIPFVGAGLSVDFGYPTWPALLQQVASQNELGSDVKQMLVLRKFEEAAELIDQRAPGALAKCLQSSFAPNTVTRPVVTGAVKHLPRFSKGVVLTTNFDCVLEAAFEDAKCPFIDVFPGASIVRASRAVQNNQRVLLKLHGTYDSTDDRVLTLTEYRKQYGPDSDAIDHNKRIPSVLSQALGSSPVLFVGCSLQNDRTTRVIASVIERLPGLTHFALLPESENSVQRCNQFRHWNIYPLFFRDGEFWRIERFLEQVANYSTRRGNAPTIKFHDRIRGLVERRMFLGATMILASVLLILLAVLLKSGYWLHDDPLKKLTNTKSAEAASAAFRRQAITDGYSDAEVVESWFGDFLEEHWLNRESVLEVLERKRSSKESGDFAVGIWHDKLNDDSVWNIYAGLSSPNVRPVLQSPSFVIQSSGIEPRSSPHRDNAGGLSSIGWAMVLGSYARSFEQPEVDWICANFKPRTAPFVETRAQSKAFEQVQVIAAPFCPQLSFLSVVDGRNMSASDRFRAFLYLPTVPSSGSVKDTIYIAIAKTANPRPLPFRASLLWLKLAPTNAPSAGPVGSMNGKGLNGLGANEGRNTVFPDTVKGGTGNKFTNPRDGLSYVSVPSGKFKMGCSPKDSECYDAENPVHEVTLTRGFWIGQTEVTQQAYDQVIGKNPSYFKGPMHPVENVSWNDADKYCKALGGRLPTEAEWEYAARAGNTNARYGDIPDIAHTDSKNGTSPVAKKRPNDWELYDMLGNVWEWVADWHSAYSSVPVVDPHGPETGGDKVLRGGPWDVFSRYSRASNRYWVEPQKSSYSIGFRCVG